METIACKALVAFTHFVPGFGQVHGDPDSSLKEAQMPEMPVSVIQALADDGRIEAPKGFKPDPLDHDGDGKKGGSKAPDDAAP